MNRYSGFRDFLDKSAQECPDQTAFVYESDGRHTFTYSQFHDAVYARAEALKETHKTCMGILSDGSYHCIIEIFAANLAGMQIVMLDRMLPQAVLGTLIQYTDADCLYGSELQKEKLSRFLTDGVKDGKGKILFFTSGTTSQSKSVVLTDSSLMAAAWNGSMMLPIGMEDTLMCMLPLGHVFGFVCGLLWGLNCHASVALGRGPRHYLDDLSFFKPTVLSAVPLLLGFLIQQDLINEELKLILVGAGDCPDTILDAVRMHGIRLSYGYGLTETSSGVAISTSGDPRAMDVCPDDTITINEDGEILIRASSTMMLGYYKLPDDTKEVLKDGILYTGDLGYYDNEGRLHLNGRKKEMLVMPNGTKIFLPEYENQIRKVLNTEKELAVVLRNSKPVLVVNELKIRKEEVMNQLGDMMKTLPRGSQLTDIIELGHELQKTATGKIKRWEIQKEIEDADKR